MEKTMTPRQVVEGNILPFNLQVLNKKLKGGEIPCHKIKGRYYLTEGDIKEYLEQHKVNS